MLKMMNMAQQKIDGSVPLLLATLLGIALCGSAAAQIIADRSAPANQQPTILNAANGVPQVNIQTPSAAGVSRNTYSQFDVQQQGAILNNSRNNTQTQLGGWVQGNPWLAAGTARVILNEVNSSNPSLLKGYVEVAGDRAQVVIANPSGVTCDGCGFINANRSTLTTGTPIMNGGSLDGYRVQGGTVTVSGAGLDASRSDYTNIIARAVQINAGLWANDLKITTGANQVSADNTQAAAIAGHGSVPGFALDVSALGGMYAGKIALIGTEAGLGVRNAGQIGASAGDVVVTTAGWLQNAGRITGSDQIRITTQGDLQNSGTLYAQGAATLAAANIDNSGVAAAAGNLTLTASGRLDNRDGATLAAGLGADGTLGSQGNLTLAAAHVGNTQSSIAAGGNLRIDTGDLGNDQGRITADGTLILAATGNISNAAGLIVAQSDLTVSAVDFDNRQGTVGAVAGNASIALDGGNLDNRNGLVSASGSLNLSAATVNNANTLGAGRGIEATSLTLSADTLLNQSGALRADADITLNLSSRLDNTQGTISSQGTLAVKDTVPTAKTLAITNDSGTLIGGLGLTVDADVLSGSGSLLSGRDMAVSLNQDFLNTGTVQASGDARFETTGTLTNQSLFQAGGKLALKAGTLDNQAAGKMIGSRLQLQATDTHTFTNRGLIDGQDTFIDAITLNNLGTGRIYGDHVALGATTLNNQAESGIAPVIAARQRLDIGASAITNSEHALIYSAGDMFIGGSLDADHHATGQASTLTNSSATIEAGNNLDISAQQIRNTNEHFSTQVVAVSATAVDEIQGYGSGTRYSTSNAYTQHARDSFYRWVINGSAYDKAFRYVYTRYISETQVLSSDPGQILSGGGMRFTADSLLNDKSKIIAGGTLTGNLGSLTNTEASGTRTTTDSGTMYFYIDHQPSGKDNDWTEVQTSGYAPAPSLATISLGVSAYQQNTAPGGNNIQIAATNLGSGVNQAVAGRQGISPRSNPTVPNNALYVLHPGNAGNYLVETDPTFASYKTWLSSDYMLSALSLDPTKTQKRLGDGAYEQKIIQEQVAELTGRRYLSGFSDDQAQYQALMSAGVSYAQAHSLTPGIALSAAQVAQLTSDIVWLVSQTVTLPDGSTTQVLVPQLYVKVKAGDITEGGSLIAANTTQLQIGGDLVNGGTIAGRSVLSINADNLKNLGGTLTGNQVSLTAQTDLINLGGQIKAGDSLSLQAGRDLTVASTTFDSTSSQGSRSGLDRIAGLYVDNPNGILLASAGQDLTLVAAQLQNQGSGPTQLSAGRDIVLGTVREQTQSDLTFDSRNYNRSASSQDVGSTLQTQSALTLVAGQNLTATAATLTSTAGALTLAAGQNVNLLAGQATEGFEQASFSKSNGNWGSKKEVTTRDSLDQMTALGSSLSGSSVQVQAGKDLKLVGGSIVSDSSTVLTAGNDLSLEAAATRNNETHFQSTKTSGLFSSGGFGITLGSQAQSSDSRGQGIGAQGSTVGSINGDITLLAGKGYKQVGSDVLAPQGDIAIQGKTIDILAARESQQTVTTTQFKQSGLTLSIGSPLVTAVQTVESMAQAAGQTSDPRMQALAAAAAGLNLYNNAKGIQDSATALANGKPLDALSINLSIGSSKSSSTSTSQSNSAKSSTVQAGKDLSIQATDGDLNAVGSQLQAGNNVLLAAANNVNLLAAANTSSQQSSNSGSSSSLGVSYSTQSGFGITLAASQNKGSGNGQDTTYTDTRVNAGNGADLVSGQDTTLKGAQVSAKQIVADVGKNLNIESLQDSSSYQSKSSNSGFSLSIPITGTNLGGSVSAGQSKIDSNYQSVNQQSGLQAGDNGFQVKVGGNTDLKGAVIASTDKAVTDNKNSFQTDGSLTLSDLQNQASYKGNALGINIGAGISNDGKLAPQGTSAGIGQAEGNASSTTQSGISGIAGNTAIRTGDSANGIQKIFDADKVQKDINAQVAITQTFNQVAPKAAASYAISQASDLKRQADLETDPEQKAALLEEAKKWAPNGSYNIAMNVIIGAAGGTLTAAITQETLSWAANEMRQSMIDDSKKFKGICDAQGNCISNISGKSVGVNGDNTKIAGGRIVLSDWCDEGRCAPDPTTKSGYVENPDGTVKFNPGNNVDGNAISISQFIEKNPQLSSPLGGHQGATGQMDLLGIAFDYAPGSFWDKLAEAYAGTHDTLNSVIWYDALGNGKKLDGTAVGTVGSITNMTNVAVATPFALSVLLPPEIWSVIGAMAKIK